MQQVGALTSRERGSRLLNILIICITLTGKYTPSLFLSHRPKITRGSMLNTSVEAVAFVRNRGINNEVILAQLREFEKHVSQSSKELLFWY
jgi:hypothetical protein